MFLDGLRCGFVQKKDKETSPNLAKTSAIFTLRGHEHHRRFLEGVSNVLELSGHLHIGFCLERYKRTFCLWKNYSSKGVAGCSRYICIRFNQ